MNENENDNAEEQKKKRSSEMYEAGLTAASALLTFAEGIARVLDCRKAAISEEKVDMMHLRDGLEKMGTAIVNFCNAQSIVSCVNLMIPQSRKDKSILVSVSGTAAYHTHSNDEVLHNLAKLVIEVNANHSALISCMVEKLTSTPIERRRDQEGYEIILKAVQKEISERTKHGIVVKEDNE